MLIVSQEKELTIEMDTVALKREKIHFIEFHCQWKDIFWSPMLCKENKNIKNTKRYTIFLFYKKKSYKRKESYPNSLELSYEHSRFRERKF